MMSILGRLVARSRTRALIVVAVWLLLAAIVPRLTPTVDEVKREGGSNAPVPGTQSAQARDLLLAEFPDQQGVPAIIVLRNPDGLTAADDAEVARISTALTGSRAPEGVDGVASTATAPRARSQLVSADGTTSTILVPIKGLPSNDERFAATVRQIRQWPAPAPARPRFASPDRPGSPPTRWRCSATPTSSCSASPSSSSWCCCSSSIGLRSSPSSPCSASASRCS